MIKRITTIYLMLLCAFTMSAQQQVNLKMNDGTVHSFFVSDVQQIFFDIYYEPRPESIKLVDLGLPSGIKWASVNYYKQGQEINANNLFSYKTTDIVAEDWSVRFGEPWRMPTQADFAELLDKCDWTMDNDANCIYVTAKDEAIKDTLCLPFTGIYKNGDITDAGSAYYWAFGSQSGNQAKYLYVYSDEDGNTDRGIFDEPISARIAIRPVWDEHQEVVEVSATLTAKKSTTFTVSVSLNNPDGLEIKEYGIEYKAADAASWTKVALTATAMSHTVSGLTPDTDYQFRGFAKTANKTFYSEVGTVHTDANTLTMSASHTDTAVKYSSVAVSVTFDAADLTAYNILEWGLYISTKQEDVDNHLSAARKTASAAAQKANTFSVTGLSEETTYYYVAYANVAGLGLMYSSPVRTFKTGKKPEFPVPDYVDLGLSVKWATFNVGASSDEEIGGYYGWGDPTGKLRSNSTSDYAPKLTSKADISKAPDDTLDIAHVKFGSNWHIPTAAQVKELMEGTDIERVSNYGPNKISGHKFMNKKDHSKYIIVPYCGLVESWNSEGVASLSTTNEAFYWTSELSDIGKSLSVMLNPDTYSGAVEARRANARCIRAVYDDGTGSSEPTPTPTPTADPMDIKETLADGSIVPAAAVDLGLTRTKWATWNLGAKKKTGDVGIYYAWGELEPKDDYGINTYTYHDQDKDFRKINGGKGILEVADDAAAQLWGGDWVMPTEDDWIELVEKTEVKWETVGGIQGYRFTSIVPGYTDKSIFLPAAGHYSTTNLWYYREFGYYWSSSAFPSDDNTRLATCMIFNDRENNSDLQFLDPSGYMTRFLGLTIRPVIPKTGYERKNAPLMQPRKLDRNKYRMFLPYNQ